MAPFIKRPAEIRCLKTCDRRIYLIVINPDMVETKLNLKHLSITTVLISIEAWIILSASRPLRWAYLHGSQNAWRSVDGLDVPPGYWAGVIRDKGNLGDTYEKGVGQS